MGLFSGGNANMVINAIVEIEKQLCCLRNDIVGSTVVFGTSFTGTGTTDDPKEINIFATGSGYLGGVGSEADPLQIGGGSGGDTIYTADGTISNAARVVTLSPGGSLQFLSEQQGTFEVDMQHADPTIVGLFRIRNGGGAGGIILSIGDTAQYLHMGQYGSELKIGDVKLNNVLSASSLSTDADGKIIPGTIAIETGTWQPTGSDPVWAIQTANSTGTYTRVGDMITVSCIAFIEKTSNAPGGNSFGVLGSYMPVGKKTTSQSIGRWDVVNNAAGFSDIYDFIITSASSTPTIALMTALFSSSGVIGDVLRVEFTATYMIENI